MATTLTPYDTGERAEPSTWTPSNSHLYSMPDEDRESIIANHRDDFGKVDFEDDESATIATVWATKADAGWTLHIYEAAGPLSLAVDTEQLRTLLDGAREAVDAAEESTEADDMETVFQARDGAVAMLQSLVAALTPVND